MMIMYSRTQGIRAEDCVLFVV